MYNLAVAVNSIHYYPPFSRGRPELSRIRFIEYKPDFEGLRTIHYYQSFPKGSQESITSSFYKKKWGSSESNLFFAFTRLSPY